MNNIIQTSVKSLRNNRLFTINQKNSNRYRVDLCEPDGSRTSYFFGTPIYSETNGKIIDFSFHQSGSDIYLIGSNANITLSDKIIMENITGSCICSLKGNTYLYSSQKAVTKYETLFPSSNGIVYVVMCSKDDPYTLTIELNSRFMQIQENGKYFAVLLDDFKPFLSVSCMGQTDFMKNIYGPIELSYTMIDDKTYEISIRPYSDEQQLVMFEVNLYEPKIFQDTTVESQNPKLNNVFGGTAYVGTTKEFGTQQLYTRLDDSKLQEIKNHKILKAILHIPKLSKSLIPLSCYPINERFCSFGSNWENKISFLKDQQQTVLTDQFVNIDITSIIRDKKGFFKPNEGIVIVATNENSGHSIIATGDNYFTPQILEINYL